jgi:hypothetical protein
VEAGRLARLGSLLLALAGSACAAPGGGPADREALQQLLEAYLPRLAQAYATGDVEPLRELAGEREVATVQKRLQEIAGQGRTLEPELRSVVVEEVEIWRHSNAYVTTLEVWDLRLYAGDPRVLLTETRAQSNRVKYQLERDAGRWIVLYRQIERTFE